MKIKRKYSRRAKAEAAPVADVSSAPIADVSSAPPAETFTANDLNIPADDKPKRKYTRRGGNEMAGFQFGELTVFAGDLAARLSSLITKQDAPLNPMEKQMLKTVGDTCGKFLLDGVDVGQLAPKYAKLAVFGMFGLIVGVRALDYFMRPRLTAGKPANIAYDVAPESDMAQDVQDVPDIQG